ncbi:MAG TPA: hypothetical protein VMD91_14345 [Candidatus Sulfotelmatobacter sp.]|nr:hypothetical protein [Candidatus Sulfotelmatobacter sp.]
MRAALAALALTASLAWPGLAVAATPLTPAAHGDFGHYTFALTWQPGLCSVDDAPLTGARQPQSCAPGQPREPLIGLHGLWPSRPQALVRAHVPVRAWWSQGCDLLHRSNAVPPLSPALRARLADAMPRLRTDLLRHEYDKHVQCFGFDPTRFFTTELAMRRVVADSSFGTYLVGRAGRTVTHDSLVAAFERGFRTADARAIQLQCRRDPHGRTVLTQLWLTIRANRLAAFPSATSLTHTPIDQDTCPATFLVAGW